MNGGTATGLGRIWKVGTRRGMVYAEGRELAEKILQASGQRVEEATVSRPVRGNTAAENLFPGTAAVYTNRQGKPFAWQIAFDVAYWDSVLALVDTGGA